VNTGGRGPEASMGKPYSQDLRERVFLTIDSGTGAYVTAPVPQAEGRAAR
jgi:hypothetical protein